jgi:hypothetical protein
MRLATLLHISDLHFGDIDPATGDATQPRHLGKFKFIDGLLGHNLDSLKRVSRFWANLRRTEQAALVVTGDLTTVGKFSQFETAASYLGGLLDLTGTIQNLLPLGLMVPDWQNRGIPGNHDHWPGRFEIPGLMFGPPAQELSDNFLNEYPKISEIPLFSGHTLKFLMIDSDADVLVDGSDRFLARGDFTTQLEKLERHSQLGDPQSEIRVLCVHHSPAHQEFALGIDSRSRGALNDFIVKQNIAVLLTGHKHTPPLVRSFRATHLGIARQYLEARCGSTSQRSTLSYTTSTKTGNRPQRPSQLPNALLVHRLQLDGDEVFWHSECYFELPTGFREKSTFSSPLIKALDIAGPFKVYPLAV